MRYVVLALVLVIAAVTDTREDKIPNELCLFALGLGLIENLSAYGWRAAWVSILSAGLLCALLFSFWMLHILGAGDIKLITVSALYLGSDTGKFLMYSGCVTAALAVVLMYRRKNLFHRFRIFVNYIRKCCILRSLRPYDFDKVKDAGDGGIRVSYGLLGGYIVYLGFLCFS